MTWLWSVAIALVALYWLAKVFPTVAAVWISRKVTYSCLQMKPISQRELSKAQRKILKPKIRDVRRYGFESVGCWQLTTMPDQRMHGVLMRHKSGCTYALLHIQLPFNHDVPVTLNIATLFSDGYSLETSNTPEINIFSHPEKHRIQRLGNVSVKDLLEAHRQEFLKIKQCAKPRLLSPKDFIDAQLQQARNQIEYARAQKEIKWVEPGQTYRMTLAHNIKVVSKMAAQMAQNPGPPPQLSDEIPEHSPDLSLGEFQSIDGTNAEISVDREVAAFMRSRQQSKLSFSRRSRTFILLASLALFLVTSSSMFDGSLNWQGLLAFAGVIAIHEAGHGLAMKGFGYHDTTVLFVPFFGALATAKKDDATLAEKVWISLAGPLPGIAMGIGLAIARSQGWVPDLDWIDQTIGFFLFLNLFNLIPIYPLDGGQVANNLLFSRNPYLGVVFQSIGLVVLAFLGLLTSSVLLLGFAVLIALTIPQNFRAAKLNAQLRTELLTLSQPSPASSTQDSTNRSTAELGPDDWIRHIFTALKSSSYKHLSFAQKSTLVNSLLDSRTEQMAPLMTRLGLSGVYIASLILGSIGSVYALSLKPADSFVASSTSRSLTPAEPLTAKDEDYFDRFYDEEFAEYSENAYFTDYKADVSHLYTCANPDASVSMVIGADGNEVMSDRQATLIATFENEAIAQSVLTTLQPSLLPSDRALVFGQSLLVSTVSQTTQSQFESTVISQDGMLFPWNDTKYGVAVYVTADAPDENTAKQVARTFWFFETTGIYGVSPAPPMPWEAPILSADQQALSERAKYTYRQLQIVEQDSWSGTPIRGYFLKSILAAITKNPQWILGEQEKMMERQRKVVRDGIEELQKSNDPYLDPETMNLYQQQADLQHRVGLLTMDDMLRVQQDNNVSISGKSNLQEEVETLQAQIDEVQQRLGQRIWQTTSRYAPEKSPTDRASLEYGPNQPWFNGYVQADGLQLQFQELNFSSMSEMLPDLTQYLCDRQFTNIRYTFVDGAEIWDY